MTTTQLSDLVKHLAKQHGQDADTLTDAYMAGDLLNLHRRLHEQMLAESGSMFHQS